MSGKRRHTPLLIALIPAVALLAGCNVLGGQDEAKGNIVIGVGPPFPTSEAPAQIAKVILENHGYDIEFISGDVGFTFAGVAGGDIDLYFDAWLPLQGPYLERYGDIEKLSVSYGNAVAGFWVPTYVKDINSIEDLVGNEERFDGTVYTPGAGYGTTISTREYLEAHPELKLEMLSSSEAALMTTVGSQAREGEEVVFTFYKPQPLFARHDYKLLEGSKEAFGVNTIWAIATPTLKEEHPEVHAAFRNWSFDIDAVQEMMVAMDNGTPAEELAEDWVEEHKGKIQSWWD